jgi:uncharacterized protein YjbI with pentapeptide repeats
MTDLSIRKKRKITITASSEAVKIAEKALSGLGFDTKINFAKSQLLARSTVTKFFQCQPIQLDSFKKICQELKLDWRKIAELSEEKPSQIPGITDCINPDINEVGEKMLTPTFDRQVTVIDKKTNTIKAEIKLIGDINSLGGLSRVEFILGEYSGDTIKITDIKEGSIRLTVEGSQEDIARLVSLIKSGELKEVSGFPVEDVQILSESSKDEESNELNNKWHLVKKIVIQAFRHLLSKSSEDEESNELNNKWDLVREIVTQGFRHRNLSGVDLSDADLSGANLSRAYLSRADLSRADLSRANLSRANLSRADLIDANLSSADLSGTNLRSANLSGTDLSGTNLRSANLTDTDLSGTNLSGADLSGADLSRTNLIGTYLIGTNLRGANLRGANLIRADLIDANLSGADLSGANLSGANLIRAGLSRADLRGADLSRAYLSGADLSGADLSGADLRGAGLSRADLSGADLSGADLRGADLSKTKVEKARFSSNLGISESMKQDLIKQGAIFEDSPGDSPEVPTKV